MDEVTYSHQCAVLGQFIRGAMPGMAAVPGTEAVDERRKGKT
jgi:hypothetical protein